MNKEQLLNKVSEVFQIDKMELLGRCRRRDIMEAKQAYCYIARKVLKLSYSEIGRVFNLSHASTMHNVKQCGIISTVDKGYNTKVLACLTFATLHMSSKEEVSADEVGFYIHE